MPRTKTTTTTKTAVQSGLIYTKDKYGKEILLKENLPVMMEWERPYVEACINALKPQGDVLEIGFGLGYSANAIQKHRPKSHTIIENDPAVLAKAKEWARQHPNVKIVEGKWEDKLGNLGQFDAIFFDDYCPLNANEVKAISQEIKQGEQLVEAVHNLKTLISKTLKSFAGIKFTDKDLENFKEELRSKHNATIEDVTSFMDTLVEMGNITEKQRTQFLKGLKVKDLGLKPPVAPIETPTLMYWGNSKEFIGDRLVTFIEACLSDHMRPNARLSAYLGSPQSKQMHKNFGKILTRKDLRYTETTFAVKVPDNCAYYKGNEALVMVIERVAEKAKKK